MNIVTVSAKRKFALCRLLPLLCAVLLTAGKVSAAPPDKAPDKSDKTAAKPAPPLPAKSLLLYKAEQGRTAKSKGTLKATIESNGTEISIEEKIVDKSTYTKVSPSGDITIESAVESRERSVNGEKVSTADDKKEEPNTETIHPDGTVVSFKGGNAKDDKLNTNIRLYQAAHIIFTNKAVGVGDTWKHDYKSSDGAGFHDGSATYEILAAEKVDDIDTFKIKVTYSETGGSHPITLKGTSWVERVSGDSIKDEATIENVPIDDTGDHVATFVLKSERFEGGPLKSSVSSGKTSDEKKEKTVDEVVKDYDKIPGLITLWRKKEAGKESLYAELREDQLNKLMLLQATASTGDTSDIVAGDPISDTVFKFTRTPDDRILFVVPNTSFRADPNSPIAKSLKRSFADAYIQVFKIEAKQADRKTLLIDVSDIFRGDIAQISQAFSGGFAAFFGGGSYSLDRDKSFILSIKNFPDNLVVATQYNFSKGGGRSLFDSGVLADSRSVPIVVNYNLFMLPNDENLKPTNGYVPRLADARVGFFTTDFQSFDDDSKSDTLVHYIYRWNLQKKDPKAPLSEPVKPIVFWMDNAIPLEYRPAVREGLLMWNKAFEKLGFKDAIHVEQMPDKADWDHADMRYNTIRWVASPAAGYAVALFRVNPITGQILNANITVDCNFPRYIKLEHSETVNPATAFTRLLETETPGNATALTGNRKFDPRRCQYGTGMMDQAWFGYTALSMLAAPGEVIDSKEYVHSYLREVVGHEMGHIMGLRHNFIASTQHTLTQLRTPGFIEQNGTGASLMDYTPFNIAALHQKGVPFYSPTVGAYDMWAIEYGYKDFGMPTPEGERDSLKSIASLCNEPGHAYQSDEIADQFDPDTTRFDLGNDPLAFNGKMLDVSHYLLMNVGKRLPKQGESYHEFTRNFEQMLFMYASAAAETTRYIGGQHIYRNFKGDKGEKPTLQPIEGTKQRDALALLNKYLFAPDALTFPTSYYTHLTVNQVGFAPSGSSQEFPIEDTLSSLQKGALRVLFSGSTLRRVANNEFKIGDPKKSLNLPYLFRSVGNNIWSEAAQHKNVPTLRRQLQRTYLDSMIAMALRPGFGTPEDARMLAWDQLREMKSRLALALAKGTYDDYTRIHLNDSLAKVNRALDARITLGGDTSSSRSALSILLGGEQPSTEPAPK